MKTVTRVLFCVLLYLTLNSKFQFTVVYGVSCYPPTIDLRKLGISPLCGQCEKCLCVCIGFIQRVWKCSNLLGRFVRKLKCGVVILSYHCLEGMDFLQPLKYRSGNSLSLVCQDWLIVWFSLSAKRILKSTTKRNLYSGSWHQMVKWKLKQWHVYVCVCLK